MSSDKQVREAVAEALDFDTSLQASNIGVAVSDGVVTLSGFVGAYAEKYAAERATGRVKGVKAIAVDLSVRLPDEARHSDDRVAERALQVLKWDASLFADEVQVKVDAGLVTLSGDVEHGFQRREAETAVRRLGGVTGVNNRIHVRAAHSPNDVRETIRKALERDAQLDARQIRVSGVDGRVMLEGKVDSWGDRKIAENAAWTAFGVREVENRLTVAP